MEEVIYPMEGVQYVLVFGKSDPQTQDFVIKLMKKVLAEHSLVVTSEDDLKHTFDEKGDSETRYLVVTASLETLQVEAESLVMRSHLLDGSKDAPRDMQEFEAEEAHKFRQFTASEKLFLLWELMESIPISDEAKCLFEDVPRSKQALSVTSLILALKMVGHIEVITPLHHTEQKIRIWNKGLRMLLSPVKEIHAYFGSEVAFYFAWMNFGTVFYLGPGLMGLILFIHKMYYGYTVDNHPYIPFFSLFVVLWGMFFIVCWNRTASVWAYKWATIHMDPETDENIRPAFQGVLEESPVTGRMERTYPHYKRVMWYGLSVLVTLAMLGVAFFVMMCSLNLQGYIKDGTEYEKAFYIPKISKYAVAGAMFDQNGYLFIIPTIVHVVVIMQLNQLYRRIAEWLTDNENHRTEYSYECALVLKRFFFEAFDCYIALFYIAFFQFDVVNLRTELVSVYTTDSIRRLFCESILPLILTNANRVIAHKSLSSPLKTLKKASESSLTKKKSLQDLLPKPGDIEDELELEEYDEFDDYLEMVIQFGYVVLFCSAFPLAAFLSIFCNVIEMKSDLFKLIFVYRRPPALRAPDTGPWEGVMYSMVILSVLTNCLIFGFSSEQMMQWMPWMFKRGELDQEFVSGWGRVAVAICFGIEHILIIAGVIILSMVPAMPTMVRNKLKKMQYKKDAVALKLRHEERKKQHQKRLKNKQAPPENAGGSPPKNITPGKGVMKRRKNKGGTPKNISALGF